MPRRTKEEALKTRSNILLAALDAIYKNGYTSSTMSSIAKAIGLSKGAVYWHFESKIHLLMELAKSMAEYEIAAMEQRTKDDRGLRGLELVITEYVNLLMDDAVLQKYYYVLAFRIEWNEELHPVRKFYKQMQAQFIEQMVSYLEEAKSSGEVPVDLNTKEAALVAYALVDGLLVNAMSFSGKRTLRRTISFALDIFMKGIRAKN